MSDQLFLIAGGGTGAKVAESFIHLCAAGLGPDDVHILLIDTDSTNGNLQRTVSTGTTYTKLQDYPWSVETTAKESSFNVFSSGENVGTHLFTSNVHLYQLTDPLATVIEGGLDTAVGDNEDVRQIVELFYNEEERKASCDDGFRARPNLGCLHLTDHLNTALVENQQSSEFLSVLANAASGATTRIPVVVTASVFGGTGASLLPVIRGCVEQALERNSGTMVNTDGLSWNAIKILPHYQPKHRKESVDPDRFLLDTASALQFYSKVYQNGDDQMYDGVYVIGSDNPGRNRVEPKLGSAEQSNPSYVEEFLAALAALDAAEHVDDEQHQKVRLFMPDATQKTIEWEDLPHMKNEVLKEQFGYLLHLAAFHLRQGGSEELSRGMDRLLDDLPPEHLRQFGWYDEIIDSWAQNAPSYESAGPNERPEMILNDSSLGSLTYGWMEEDIAEYFGRLLMWAETALKGEGLSLVDYHDSDYAAIHNAMSSLSKEDVEKVQSNGRSRQVTPEDDNAMIRTLRTALAAMVRLHHNDVSVKVDVEKFQLVDEHQRIPLAITLPEIEKALQKNGLRGVQDMHTRTQVA